MVDTATLTAVVIALPILIVMAVCLFLCAIQVACLTAHKIQVPRDETAV
jgi:hypothetical protein